MSKNKTEQSETESQPCEEASAYSAERAPFIVFEGIDGTGKTTLARALHAHFLKLGRPCTLTQEPGGTALGERLRDLLMHDTRKMFDGTTQALLFSGARRAHLENIIKPALMQGRTVICDRFSDSTWAYQGGGHHVNASLLKKLEDIVLGEERPNLTFILTGSIEVFKERLKRRGGFKTVYERQDLEFYERVQNTFKARAKKDPSRYCRLDADKAVDKLLSQVIEACAAL